MRFDDVWMQYWQLRKLSDLAFYSCDAGAVIEIGTYQGLSAIPIANVINPKTLHVVDHWNGSSDWSPEMRERDNFDIFIANIMEAQVNNIEMHRQDWRDFARHWTDKVGFLHLDAEHTKDEVSGQIETFLPHMANGSILAGDDYNFSGVHEGIAVHFPPVKVNVLRNKLWWVEFE